MTVQSNHLTSAAGVQAQSDESGESDWDGSDLLTDPKADVAVHNDDDVNDDEGEDEEIIQYSEYFNLEGSNYHKHFQSALRQCKRLLINKEIPVQLMIEPTNMQDENAITVQVKVDHVWQKKP